MSAQRQQGGNRNLDSYVGVHTRVEKFRADHPTARLVTHVIGMEPLTIRAEVWLEGNESDKPNSCGTASEEGGMGNRAQSPVEKVETAAVGRCLAFLGYEVKEGIASREEVQAAPLRPVTQSPPPKPLEQPSAERRELLERVTGLCVELGYDLPKQLAARAKAASMTDAEIKAKVIPSLEKLLASRDAEASRLRTAIYAEFGRMGLSEGQITGYLKANNEGRTLEASSLEQLQAVAEGLEVK